MSYEEWTAHSPFPHFVVDPNKGNPTLQDSIEDLHTLLEHIRMNANAVRDNLFGMGLSTLGMSVPPNRSGPPRPYAEAALVRMTTTAREIDTVLTELRSRVGEFVPTREGYAIPKEPRQC